jgi:broad specificity phosphatase PhoE
MTPRRPSQRCRVGTSLSNEPDPRDPQRRVGRKTPDEIAAGWPDLWTRYRGGEDVPRPGGERWADVRTRTLATLEPLLDEDGITVVVSHGGPILIGAHWATGQVVEGNVFRGQLGAVQNTSLTVIDPGPKLTAFNDVGHLDPFAGFEVPDAPV